MTARAIWNEDMKRAMEMATGGTPAPGQDALKAQHAAAVTAWDSWQRNQLPEDNPCYLPAAAVEAACTAFVALYTPPAPAVHDHSLSQAVIDFAEKADISLDEAEAVLAHLKPLDGHRANALLAQQVFESFAKLMRIRVTDVIASMREWANDND